MSFATATTGNNYRVVGRPRGRLGESGSRVLAVMKDLTQGDCVDGVTWRDVFAKACMSRAMTQETVKNLEPLIQAKGRKFRD